MFALVVLALAALSSECQGRATTEERCEPNKKAIIVKRGFVEPAHKLPCSWRGLCAPSGTETLGNSFEEAVKW